MNKITIQQGDSLKIAVILPIDRMNKLMDVVCQINCFTYKLSDDTLTRTSQNNIFDINLKSAVTQTLPLNNELIIALYYTDIGVKKTSKNENLQIIVSRNENRYFNQSFTQNIKAVVTITITEEVVNTNIDLANYLKGSAFDNTFETISKNLIASNIVSTTDTLITYVNGVTKTITFPNENTIIVKLSGNIPIGIANTKTITFPNDTDFPIINYSIT